MSVASVPSPVAATGDDGVLDLFLAALDRFAASHLDARAIDRGGMPRAVLAALAELGVFGVSLPARWGGSELGLAGACAVVESLARRDRAVATTVGLHLGLGTRALVAHGDEAQKDRFLPALASGQRIGAFAVTEPGAGSDLARLETRVARAIDGSLRLDGNKIYVTNGGLAGLFTIAAASPTIGGSGSACLVLVEPGDGVVIGPEEDKLGLRGSSTVPLYFDGIALPADCILGPAGDGHRLVGETLAWGRTILAAGATGTGRAAFDAALAHVTMRRQFGRALASQPVVRTQLADMAADVFAMRALVRASASVESDGARLERRSLAAKVFCSERDWNVCDTALQLLGGLGYLEHSGVPLMLRDARVTRIFEGANDVLATRLGTLELVQPDAEHDEDARVARAAEVVREGVEHLRTALGVRALRRPDVLWRLGRMAILREAARAVVAADVRNDVDRTLADRSLDGFLRAIGAFHPLDLTCDHGADAICDALFDVSEVRA